MSPSTENSQAQSIDNLRELVHKNTVAVPKFGEEQARDALSVIPTDYWGLNRWTCKNAGHSTFTCPTLTPDQRIYYAYCYFLYKCKDKPTAPEWLRQRFDTRMARPKTRGLYKYRNQGTAHGAPRNDFRETRAHPGRKDRDTRNRGVRFDRPGRVYVTTHVPDEHTAPWRDHENAGSTSSDDPTPENLQGQE